MIEVLSHASKVVKPGRSFLRRLIEVSKIVKELDHFVCLSREASSDIEWWFRFVDWWNGVSIMYQSGRNKYHKAIISDASGSWGCGAFCHDEWFQLRWNVMSHCDNAAVVAILNKGDCKDPEAMHLVRCLAFLKAKFLLIHIPY